MSEHLDISGDELESIREILARYVPEYDVFAFGSRVTDTARVASDLDLVIMTDRPLETLRMADLRDAFTESDLPFKVDIADWATLDEGFRRRVNQNRKIIRSGNTVPLLAARLNLDTERIAVFCAKWKIQELSVFGSVLRQDFSENSDIDFLVSFLPDNRWSLFDFVEMQDELAEIVGRPVDFIQREAIEKSDNYLRRRAILREIRQVYAA